MRLVRSLRLQLLLLLLPSVCDGFWDVCHVSALCVMYNHAQQTTTSIELHMHAARTRSFVQMTFRRLRDDKQSRLTPTMTKHRLTRALNWFWSLLTASLLTVGTITNAMGQSHPTVNGAIKTDESKRAVSSAARAGFADRFRSQG